MPLPPGVATCIVTGTWVQPSGLPAKGQVGFYLAYRLVDQPDKVIVTTDGVVATLDATGHISVALPFTDNTAVNPTGFFWQVIEKISGGGEYFIELPTSTGPTVDLSTLVPVSGTNRPVWAGAPFALLAGDNVLTGHNTFTQPVTGVDGGSNSLTTQAWVLAHGGGGPGGGTTWYYGTTVPSPSLGVVGDFYYRTSTGDVYSKSAAGWGAPIANMTGPTGSQGPAGDTGVTGPAGPQGNPGTPGTPGADGKSVRSGTGVPAAGLGVDGDFYIDTAAHAVYGPKTAGSWGAGTSMVGPQGDPGTTGATGSTGPAGPGVPTGGTTGQYLNKINTGDYNTQWSTLPAPPTSLPPSGPAGGDLSGTYPNPLVAATANFKAQVATVRLDQMAAPAGPVSMNGQKITSVLNGTAAQDAAAFGQIPTTLPPNGTAGGDLGSTYPNPQVVATHLAAPLPIAQGGTASATAAAAITTLTGPQTAGRYLRSDGTNATLAVLQAADVPTLNQNTTGTAANVTGIVAIANGGTGVTTQTFLNLGGDITGGTVTAPQVTATHLSAPLPIVQGGTGSGTQNFVDLATNQTAINGNKMFTGNVDVSGHALGIWTPRESGLLAATGDPRVVSSSGVAPAGGTIFLSAVFVARSMTVSKIIWGVATTAMATPTAGQNWIGLVDPSGTVLASVGVDGRTTANSMFTESISSQSLTPGLYRVAFLFNATTLPTIVRHVGVFAALVNVGLTAANFLHATNGTTQTVLPASFTLTSNVSTSSAFWAALQ